MKRSDNLTSCLACLGTALILSACGGADSSESLSSAKGYLDKKDVKAAVIQLKNALQKNPDLPEARFLLGKTYLASGDFAAALSELRRARDLKYPDEKVLPELARAMLHEQQERQFIDQFAGVSLSDKTAGADLKTSLASAYSAKGDSTKAQAAVESALSLVPDYSPALRVRAVLAAKAGQFDQALAMLEALLTRSPRDSDAWHTKGEFLLYGKHDVAGAVSAFRQALAIDPGNATSRASLITTLLAEHDLPAASSELDILRKTMPRQPQTAYFEAQLAFFRNDFKRAHEIADQLVRLSPDSVQVRQLAGAVELKLGLLLEAERSLSRALQLVPSLATSRRLLAETYLRRGQPGKALETLAPLLAEGSTDAEAVSLAAEANLQAGDLAKAETHLAKVAALDPQNMQSRVGLALSKLRKGRESETIAELRGLAASDRSTYADLTLASLYIRNKDFANALKTVDAIDAKQPGQAFTENLRGRVYLMQGDLAQARSHFEKALAIDPAFIASASTLAGMDIAEKQPERARKRFEAVLKADPKNLDALMALAGMRAKAGASGDEIAGLMKEAIRLNPTAPAPRLVLIDGQIERNDLKAAVSNAEEAVAALPTSAQILDALGRAQLASGDANQAVSTFGKLATLDPGSPLPFLRLATVQVQQRNAEAAIQSYKKAIAIDPNLLEAQKGLVELQLAGGHPDEAMVAARAMQQQHPADPSGYLLEATVEAGRNRPLAAATVYRNVLKRFPNPQIASRLYATLASANRVDEAEQFAASWSASHPKDAEFLFLVGNAAMERHDHVVAEARFREALKLSPDNVAALNNVAWILASTGKSGAVDYAKRATTLVPSAASLWDTLALALAADNKISEAIGAQRKAVDLAPSRSSFRVGLVKLYLRAGDKEKARAELDTVSKAADRTQYRDEVETLNRQL